MPRSGHSPRTWPGPGPTGCAASLGEPGAEATPFTDPATGIGWEDDEAHPRSGAELAWALESTWAVVADCLARWTPAMLPEPLALRFGDVVRYHSRGSILNRLVSHDAFHAGEISQLLGANGLPAIDLWTRDRSSPERRRDRAAGDRRVRSAGCRSGRAAGAR